MRYLLINLLYCSIVNECLSTDNMLNLAYQAGVVQTKRILLELIFQESDFITNFREL